MRLKREQHLRHSGEFENVRTSGVSRECGVFLWQILSYSPDERPPIRRIGVIASRRTGNAVQRNFAKRRLRAVFREFQNLLPDNCDLVLVARKRILSCPFELVEQRFRLTAEKLSPPKPQPAPSDV